jgi:HK97 family phage major capsid protein/HK97 family phage prohead protease
MSDEIKVGRLARDLSATTIEVRKADDGHIRLSFPASSEAPVERWFGTEVLAHKREAVRMERLEAGAAPLLFNHDWADPVGVITGARIEAGRLYVDAQMFKTERAKEVALMVDGGLRNVSVGYEIEELEEDKKRGVFTATRWQPLEVSIVTVPADASVGIGRAADDQAKPVRVVRAGEEVSQPAAPAASVRSIAVSDQTNAAAGANAEAPASLPAQPRQGPTALDLENTRRKTIENLCEANKIDGQIREHWIATGQSVDSVSKELLAIVRQRAENTQKESPTRLGLTEREAKRFSIFRAASAIIDKNWTNAGFELECTREIAKRLGREVPDPNKFFVPQEIQERQVQYTPGATLAVGPYRSQYADYMRRDLTAGSPSGGGYTVGTQNVSFIELQRNRSMAFRLGATPLPGQRENITIPRQTATGSATWLANEASTISEVNQTFGQLSLSPKNVGAYTEISRQLMLQSNPSIEGIVTSDLANVVALAVDTAVLAGSGSAGQPTGIINTAGIGSVTGTSLAFEDILEFQTDVAASNVMPARGGYATTHAVASLCIQRVKYSSTASPLWEGNVWDGVMQGFPAMASNQMSSGTMLFGDWSQVLVAEFGTLEIEVNPYAAFTAAIVGIRAIYTMDCGLRYAGAFSYASSIT